MLRNALRIAWVILLFVIIFSYLKDIGGSAPLCLYKKYLYI